MFGRLLLGKEPKEEHRKEREEDDRLLDGHRHAGELLVRVRGETPEPIALDVPVVHGLGEQSEQEPDRARQDEGDEQVQRPGGAREAVRHVLEDGPPQQAAGGEVTDVLDVQQGCVLERGVVGRGDVPGEVRDEPEAERDRRPGEEPGAGEPGEPRGEEGRDAEYQERRRPLGQDDVLEQMCREQVVGQRVERRYGGCYEQQAAGGESSDPPGLRASSADEDCVREGQRDDGEGRLKMKRPRVWVWAADRATLVPASRPW
jgi:hypothetical protein